MTFITFFFFLLVAATSSARPLRRIPGGFQVEFSRRDLSGSIGLGDNSDLIYTVPLSLSNTTTIVHLDTGSSDLWVISDLCTSGTCGNSVAPRLDYTTLNTSGASVTMYYGDSSTGTLATGPVAYDSASLAGITIPHQAFVGVNYTTNPVVQYGAAGIFGLGFPAGSIIQQSLSLFHHGSQNTTDAFVEDTYAYGPLLSRIVQSNALDNPMFTISLQRDTIDPSSGGGTGTLTIGTLPPGVDNSSLTWVPVRLYTPAEGGLQPPTFAPDEIYPYRWEIPIEGVWIDGTKLPASSIPALGGVDNGNVTSALIDTGNSLIRGPNDVIGSLLSLVSASPSATIPCDVPHTLAFQIGGKMFPIDPRDFISAPTSTSDGTLQCTASNVVGTDPPNVGTLFRWSLGDPFMKSNLIAFHYGNLTHPSTDPPRIGILNTVPSNANQLLQDAVSEAEANGGMFSSTSQIAPTAVAQEEMQNGKVILPSSVDFLPVSSAQVMTSTALPSTSTSPTVAGTSTTTTSAQASQSPNGGSRTIGFGMGIGGGRGEVLAFIFTLMGGISWLMV